MSISFVSKGSFDKTERFLKRILNGEIYRAIDRYAQIGTNALKGATPVESGETAASWSHRVTRTGGGWQVAWYNSHVNQGANIAILLQYGHGTGTGGYVRGRDYINPAIKPVFQEIADAVWREVTRT